MKSIQILLAATLGLSPLAVVALSLEQTPLFIASTEPRVMLLLSRDHELYKKAYTDYSDLNGDGVLDTTYNDEIEYYGYFDSKRCYSYSSDRYEPSGAVTTGTHQCDGSTWSGNFMNWATMTRMDVARKVLYGGTRSTDADGALLGSTVLERTLIPSDVHAFAKVFAPAGGATEVQQYVPVASASVTLCNVSRPALGTLSKDVNTSTSPPKVRVATGSWAQWAASEIVQCRTNDDSTTDTNYSTRPASATDYNVRVAVCVPNKLETNCKAYPSGAVKPVGLLQRYGDVDAPRRVRFGLMTGSYANNKQGGVLRRNTSLIAGNTTAALNEINSNSGTFTNNAGIIDTMNRLRISGFRFGDRLGSSPSNQYTDATCGSPAQASFPNGNCPDWGNPVSEMYLESLRYFAGEASPTSGFATTDSSHLASPLPSDPWSDPLPSTEWCALSNIVVLSTGLNSFDGDNLGSAPAGINIDDLTNMVGTAEGLAGATVFAGSNGVTTNNQCTAKTIGNLSNVSGICPEVPAQAGTYKIAGLANANREVDLRPTYQTQRNARWGDDPNTPDFDPVNADWAERQPLATYTVALAESIPTFSVTTEAGSTINFLPACQAHAAWTPCTLTDVRVQSATATGGTFLAVWEDSQWGFDYDMDAISRVTWCVGSACSPAVGANEVKFYIAVPQKVSGAQMRFGVIVNGSTADGISSLLNGPGSNYNCTDSNCTASTPASAPTPLALTYTAGTSTAKTLKNPLWYAAKYGAQASVWDLKDNNNPLLGPDGEPDNFFEVRNPANLEKSLAEVFDKASVPDAAASSVATNAANLQIDNYIFQAKFQPTEWSGQLISQRLQVTSGVVTLTEKWDAAPKLDAQSPAARIILTKGASGDGVSFEWANLTSSVPPATPPSQQTLLNTNEIGLLDGLGSTRLDYLRGVRTNEGTGPGQFRVRNSVLGDIINSAPLYVGTPSAGYSDVDHPGYEAFRLRYLSRKPVVYVGANDGMLHGFDAELDSSGEPVSTGGNEVIAYVPTQVYGTLSRLSAQNYNRNHRYLVDGSPMAADAYLDLGVLGTNDEDKWRTVLIGNMNSGGKGYFALDITNPNLSESAPTFSTSTANAAALLLWEFTDADDADMGYAYNLPPQYAATSQAKQIVKLEDNKWAAIVGNGYNSSLGKAVLFGLYIEKGVDGSWATTGDYFKLEADAGPNNGLSTPVPFDRDGDGLADVAYAGDLLGNMWRFDLSNPASPTKTLLFSGGITKPITTPPEVFLHPSGGTMVLFGTGKYLELTDNANSDAQSMYGVRDDGSGATVLASDLVGQTISLSGTVRTITSNPVTTEKGWFINLPTSKERHTGIPKLRDSGLFFFNTVIPSASACEQGGTGWLMAVDSLTGGQFGSAVFDSDNDGTLDPNVAGLEIGAALGGTTFVDGVTQGVAISQLTSGELDIKKVPGNILTSGRVNWREILQ